MQRTVSTRLELAIEGRTNMVFSLAAARPQYFAAESLSFELDGKAYQPQELVDERGTRLHEFVSDAGKMVVEYSATVTGRTTPAPVAPIDLITYLRPSRYCQSDEVFAQARRQFRGLQGEELMAAVMEVGDGSPAAMQNFGAKALGLITAFQEFLASSEKIEVCDDNPFEATVSIRATLTPPLQQMAAMLQAAMAAR